MIPLRSLTTTDLWTIKRDFPPGTSNGFPAHFKLTASVPNSLGGRYFPSNRGANGMRLRVPGVKDLRACIGHASLP